MSLDEGYVPGRELEARDRERQEADRRADYEEQRLTESVEAEEAHWAGAMRESAAHYSSAQHWGGT